MSGGGGGRVLWCCSWLLCWFSIFNSVFCLILPSFSWDPRNLCFSESVDGAHLSVDQESQLYILCPTVAIIEHVEENISDQKNMYENMFLCTKEEFDRCQLDEERGDGRTRLVISCDDPLDTGKLTYQSFRFQQFQSGEHGYAFEVGRTYYFIATSNGTKEGLFNREGGRCRNHNMKLSISICAQGEQCHLRNKPCTEPSVEAVNDKVVAAAAASIDFEMSMETTPQKPTAFVHTTAAAMNTTMVSTIHSPCSTQTPTFRHPSVVAAPQVSQAPYVHEKSPISSSSSKKTMVLVGVGAFVGGIVFSLLSITVYNKSCNGGSSSCCFKNRKSVSSNGVTQLMA